MSAGKPPDRLGGMIQVVSLALPDAETHQPITYGIPLVPPVVADATGQLVPAENFPRGRAIVSRGSPYADVTSGCTRRSPCGVDGTRDRARPLIYRPSPSASPGFRTTTRSPKLAIPPAAASDPRRGRRFCVSSGGDIVEVESHSHCRLPRFLWRASGNGAPSARHDLFHYVGSVLRRPDDD